MPGIRFLFWNVNRQPLDERVGRIVTSRQVDVVLLAETGTAADILAGQLERSTGSRFIAADGGAGQFAVCFRLPRRAFRLALDAPRWRVYRVVVDQIPGQADAHALNIAGVPIRVGHFQSRRVEERDIFDVGASQRASFEEVAPLEHRLKHPNADRLPHQTRRRRCWDH